MVMRSYSSCTVVGFDLDGTLYQGSAEIDALIQTYIYEKIAEHKNIGILESKKLFDDLYKEGRGLSGRKTLIALDIPNAGDIVQEALEQADVASVLTPDREIVTLLNKLTEHGKELAILTGSNKAQLDAKLAALELPQSLFAHIITDEIAHKSSGDAYKLWLSHYEDRSADDFVYIGDRPYSDYEVPSSLGINTILVNTKEVSPHIACPQLSTVYEIEELLL